MRTSHCRPRLVATTSVFLGLVALTGCGETVPAPTAFATYNGKDGRWSCDYPQGWKADGGGNSDYGWAKFTKGGAAIHIDADIAGSLFGDIAKSSSGGDDSGENAPVAKVHPMYVRHMKEEYANYQEREPKVIKSGLGDGRRSTFTADQSLGGKVFGYRATFLSNDRRITVVCRCPAANWQTLKPAFEKVITSVRP